MTALAVPEVVRWTVEEYHRIGESGLLDPGAKTELLDGLIVRKTPPEPPHSTLTYLVVRALRKVFGEDRVRQEQPFRLNEGYAPQPDAAVTTGTYADYLDAHPVSSQILLVAEVSDANLRPDLALKVPAYAAAGIPELWILDLRAREVRVHREPRDGEYADVRAYAPGETISPLAAPGSGVAVSELFPL